MASEVSRISERSGQAHSLWELGVGNRQFSVNSPNDDANRITAPHADAVPFFRLRSVRGFNARNIPGLADTARTQVEREDIPNP